MAPTCGELKGGNSPDPGALAELQGLTKALLDATVHAPQLIVLQGKMLEAVCPLALSSPDVVVAIITKARPAAADTHSERIPCM